jgi:HEAT repeat protein
MEQIDQLIEQAQSQGNDAREAIARLSAIGMPALPSIVDAVRRMSPQQNTNNLREAALGVRDPQLAPALAALLQEPSMDLVMIAFEGLGRSRDERALAPLLAYVTDTANRKARRSLAADALGKLRDPRAVDALLRVADEAAAGREYELALSAIIALAKLGNHERADVAIRIAAEVKDPLVRPRAVESLRYVVGRGLVAALGQALRDRQAEVRVNAV